MKISERTLRISAASFIALLSMSASYLLSGPNFLTSRFAQAGTTEELLKAYAAKDTDGDGLPDWQEALYGTDPNKAISNSFGISDGEAAKQGKLTPNTLAPQLPSDPVGTTTNPLDEIPGVDPAPGSVTEQFSREFLQEVINASNGQQLTDEQKQEVVTTLFKKYSLKSAVLFNSTYTKVSVKTSSTLSVQDYAGNVEKIFLIHDVPTDANQPLPLIEALIQNDDESARPKIKALSDSYRAITTDLLALPVPPSLINQHLLLIQGFDTLSKATASVVTFEKDPLRVMGGLSVYQPASNQVVTGIKGIATLLIAAGEPAKGEPGAILVNVARSTETP